MSFKVVIPARYASTRLPGKALAIIGDLPMVERVRQQALLSKAEEVWVATDDMQIADVVREHGGQVCMTGSEHQSGTERIGEVVQQLGWGPKTIVVNVQGDEPFISPKLIEAVAHHLQQQPLATVATLATPLSNEQDYAQSNIVKVARNQQGMALYFRRLLPPKEAKIAFKAENVFRHIGIYAYRAQYLSDHLKSAPSPDEISQKLEQLRTLALGYSIYVGTLQRQAPPLSVDTPEDLLVAQEVAKALTQTI